MARILVVDDEPDVRELVEALLAGPGRHIEGADGGKVALERLAAQAYDLVVCDLRMPEVDGVQVFLAIQQGPPRARRCSSCPASPTPPSSSRSCARRAPRW